VSPYLATRVLRQLAENYILLTTILEELKEKSDLSINFSPAEQEKALGLRWNLTEDTDTLSVSVAPLQPPLHASKRSVCSAIARTFDVMDWSAPAMPPAKLLLQEFWNLELPWDKEIPDNLGRLGLKSYLFLATMQYQGT